ncbi:hypothetical protein HID58_077270, partial [Brassica napus]
SRVREKSDAIGGSSKQMPFLIEHPVVPPGFAPLFPEMPHKERDMALQYISHSDPTERQARITRVQQSLQLGFEDNLGSAPRISHDINKGKGHVFNFQEHDRPGKRVAVTRERSAFSEADLKSVKDRTSFPSDNLEVSSSSSSLGPTVFRVGTSTGNLSTGANEAVKKSRRRPQRWKRICSQRPSSQAQDLDHTGKRDSPVGDGEESTATLGEDANQILEMRPQLNRHDTMVWGFSRSANVGDKEDIDENVGESALACWRKPYPSFIKCNVGSSWTDANQNCGVAWLTRNHLGVSLIHSRRSYSMVASQLEAELLSFLWAAESLSTLRHKNVVANQCAEAIARSVTRDQRYASYVGKDGPSWLLPMIHADAVRADNGY